jgi:hypothetical protein
MDGTAYAVRRQIDGRWWSRYGGWGSFWQCRLYQTGPVALSAWRYHCDTFPFGPEPIEVVEVEPRHRGVHTRYP